MIQSTVAHNSQNNMSAREDRTFFVSDPRGCCTSLEHGFYLGDTRLVHRYRWNLGNDVVHLRSHNIRPDVLFFHYSRMNCFDQLVAFQRRTTVGAGTMTDELVIQNTSSGDQEVDITLAWDVDFRDIFLIRGFPGDIGGTVSWEQTQTQATTVNYVSDVLSCSVRFSLDGDLGNLARFQTDMETRLVSLKTSLAPGEQRQLGIHLTGSAGVTGNTFLSPAKEPLPDYQEWIASFPPDILSSVSQSHREVLTTAATDLRSLLFRTAHGNYPAAGTPWYMAPFGRDALVTSFFLLPWRRDIAYNTLCFLSEYQGKKIDPFREEAPGKIVHEMRLGELSLRNVIPHGCYYGSIDATPLYLMLCFELAGYEEYHAKVVAMRDSWEAALSWIYRYGDRDGDGFVEYDGDSAAPAGTVTQTWKDSADSMSHADGSLAVGDVAGAEIQGYVYAAIVGAARLYECMGEMDKAREWISNAEQLKRSFNHAFWIEQKKIYALGLDGMKRPLDVMASNMGHLLWTGIVPDERAALVRDALFSPSLWSGWGIRTLGTCEIRYNPLSYHNGSVWPHDNALTALGLSRYGYHDDAARIRDALFEVASLDEHHQLPELIAGYEKDAGPYIPFPVACRPQAWDAAALLGLAFRSHFNESKPGNPKRR